MSFTGVTFAQQKVLPSDDAVIRRALLSDGILYGCELSYSGSTLTMGAGQLLICGRQIRHPSAQNWAVVDATSGFARLVLTIDLTLASSKEIFDQVTEYIEYASAEDGFPELDQTDVNVSGTRYQVAVCVVSLGTGGITGIVSQLQQSRVEGGAGLNFSVVGGETQPTDPAENTIWVNTSTDISSWIFCAAEPKKPAEGMVWIESGLASGAEFNALKKNGIVVYPVWVRQFADGAFSDRYASIYQNGEWVQFSEVITALYIIKDGYVDVEKYPYKYTYQYWNSSTSSNSTKSGGVDSSRIKFEQDYEGKLAVWTEATNGAWQRNEFSNIAVPNSASVFYFQYYQLPVYSTATIKVGDASASVSRISDKYRYNETVAIDVTALRGQNVTFSYQTGGQAGAQSCYVGNAWFE